MTTVTTRHPAGLKVIFLTEMWERFSYYGMRALLVLYLVNGLGYARADALELYGTYTGLAYMAMLLGGYLADRYLGVRQAAIAGAIVMVLGHFAMAFPSLLHMALGLLIVGNGFFKPNTSAMVGMLYEADDPRRNGGYTIFYMGINLGAFFSPLVAGTLGEGLGWHWGFASAGVGMAIGLATLLRWQSLLGQAGLRPGQIAMDAGDWHRILTAAGLGVASVLLVLQVWAHDGAFFRALSPATKLALGLAAITTPFLVAHLRKRADVVRLDRADWHAILAICVVVFFVSFFWMGFEQAGGTMNLFADKLTDRRVLQWEIPASWFQSINPLAIMLLAPAFSALWLRLDRSRYAIPDTAKQAFGMMVLGLGFVVLAVAQGQADQHGPIGPQWLIAVYVLHTVGELMLSPVGLALVSKIAPAQVASLLMGLWFLSSAAANYLSGTLEAMLKDTGIPLYWFLVGSSFGSGLVLLGITPWLRRLMQGRQG